MARGMGGGDNVMGSKEAVVNVAFKDDLGNILENAEKFKEILDAVNQNFLAINSVVGITTNTMGRLASQTQKLVSTTQQLRNEYQIIADASQRIGISSPPRVNSDIFANPQAVESALGGRFRGAALLGETPTQQAIGSTGHLDKLQVDSPRTILDAFRNRGFQGNYNPDRYKYRMDSNGRFLNSDGKVVKKAEQAERLTFSERGAIAAQDYQAGLPISTIASKMLGASEVPILGTVGASIPYVRMAYMAFSAIYKAADYLVKGATRYSGMTGGTGVYQNTGAAEGSQTFIGLQARAWAQGLTNMAVGPGGYQQIQESLLGAGYTARDDEQYAKLGIRGLRYEAARSTLARLYGQGLQDVDQNLQLMQMVVERGGGSLTTLTGTIENLRKTALTTNASLKVMMNTMTASIAGLIGGMNVQGSVATFVGGVNAAAFANADNSLLRGRGAPNYQDYRFKTLLMQSPAFLDAGITPQNYYGKLANPSLFPQGEGMAIASATDFAVDTFFAGMFPTMPKGTSVEEAKRIIGENSSDIIDTLMQSGALEMFISDPEIRNNADAVIEYFANMLTGNPQTAGAEAAHKQNLAHDIETGENRYTNIMGNRIQTEAVKTGKKADAEAYLAELFGTEQTLLGKAQYVAGMGIAGVGMWIPPVAPAAIAGGLTLATMGAYNREIDGGPVTQTYADYVRATGKGIGWVENVLTGTDGSAAGRTFVKLGTGDNAQTMSMERIVREAAAGNKTYQAMLDGTSDTKLMVGEIKKGQKVSDFDNWVDAAEYGGSGVSANKALQDMTRDDFADAVMRGLRRFNENSAGLRVRDYDKAP